MARVRIDIVHALARLYTEESTHTDGLVPLGHDTVESTWAVGVSEHPTHHWIALKIACDSMPPLVKDLEQLHSRAMFSEHPSIDTSRLLARLADDSVPVDGVSVDEWRFAFTTIDRELLLRFMGPIISEGMLRDMKLNCHVRRVFDTRLYFGTIGDGSHPTVFIASERSTEEHKRRRGYGGQDTTLPSENAITIMPWYTSYSFKLPKALVQASPALLPYKDETEKHTELPYVPPLVAMYVGLWKPPGPSKRRLKEKETARGRKRALTGEFSLVPKTALEGMAAYLKICLERLPFHFSAYMAEDVPDEHLDVLLTSRHELEFLGEAALPFNVIRNNPETGAVETLLVDTPDVMQVILRERVEYERRCAEITELCTFLRLTRSFGMQESATFPLFRKIMKRIVALVEEHKLAAVFGRMEEIFRSALSLHASIHANPSIKIPRCATLWGRCIGVHGPTVSEALETPEALVGIEARLLQLLREGWISLRSADPNMAACLTNATPSSFEPRWDVAFVPGVWLRHLVLKEIDLWQDDVWWNAHSARGWTAAEGVIRTECSEDGLFEGPLERMLDRVEISTAPTPWLTHDKTLTFSCRAPSPLLALLCPFEDRAVTSNGLENLFDATLVILLRVTFVENVVSTNADVRQFNNALTFVAQHMPRVVDRDLARVVAGDDETLGPALLYLVSDAASTKLVAMDFHSIEHQNVVARGQSIVPWEWKGTSARVMESAKDRLENMSKKRCFNNEFMTSTQFESTRALWTFRRPLDATTSGSSSIALHLSRRVEHVVPFRGHHLDDTVRMGDSGRVREEMARASSAVPIPRGVPHPTTGVPCATIADNFVLRSVVNFMLQHQSEISSRLSMYNPRGTRQFSSLFTWGFNAWSAIEGDKPLRFFANMTARQARVAAQLLHGALYNVVEGQLWRTDFLGSRAYVHGERAGALIDWSTVFRSSRATAAAEAGGGPQKRKRAPRGHAVTNSMPFAEDESKHIAEAMHHGDFVPRHIPTDKSNDSSRLLTAAFWAFVSAGTLESPTARVPLRKAAHLAWDEVCAAGQVPFAEKLRLVSTVWTCGLLELDQASPHTTILTRRIKPNTYPTRMLHTLPDVPRGQRSGSYAQALASFGFATKEPLSPLTEEGVRNAIREGRLLCTETVQPIMNGPGHLGLAANEVLYPLSTSALDAAVFINRIQVRNVNRVMHEVIGAGCGFAIKHGLEQFLAKVSMRPTSNPSVTSMNNVADLEQYVLHLFSKFGLAHFIQFEDEDLDKDEAGRKFDADVCSEFQLQRILNETVAQKVQYEITAVLQTCV